MISQKSDHAAFSCYELTNHIYYALYTIHFPYHIRDAVGAVKYQSGINGDSMKKLAQSKPFGLRRRCGECIPTGCRTVLLRNRMYSSNGQTANRGRRLCAAAKICGICGRGVGIFSFCGE